MRRLVAGLLVAVLALGAVACGGDDGSDATTTSGTSPAVDLGLREPGALTVASDIPYAPFAFTEPGSSDPVGFDVDLVEAIAATQGITEVVFVDQPFDGIILGLRQGRFDMSASAWTITPERAREVLFGDPYLSADQAILVRDDSDAAALADLEGRTIGAQRGTAGADVGAGVPGATVRRYESGADAVDALLEGRVDATIGGYPVVAYAAARTPGLKVAAEVPGDLGLGLMFPKGDAALRDAFDAGLARVRADGTYEAIRERWFGEAPAS